MPILPLRGLGTKGIVKDVDPFDLSPDAFSEGVNVRFDNGVMSRGPVFREVTTTIKNTTTSSSPEADFPYFVDAVTPSTGQDAIIVAFGDGQAASYTGAGATATNLSVSGWVDNTTDTPFTSCRLANIYYLNRPDRVPWSLSRTDTLFQNLANWNANWRTKVLRSYNSQLIALNVTKNSTQFPTMVKWSEYTANDSVPISWDETSPLTSAAENILADMRSEILDGLPLRSSFMIYSRDETWEMMPSGNTSVYAFRRLYNDRGIINTNCVVENDGKHYVFGFDDIYVHDGNRAQSLAQGRVRKFIYSTMNKKYANRFFVVHHRDLNEIMFCYVSGDGATAFKASNGEACNRAASYNYVSDTWTFYDLPLITFASSGNIDTSNTYNSVLEALTYENAGGSYLDQDDGFKRNVFMVGLVDQAQSLANNKLFVFDDATQGNVLFPIVQAASKPAYVGRTGIDLDEIEAELRGYKHITQIYPEGRVSRDGLPLTFTFGASVYPEDIPAYGDPMTYNGLDLYKLDYRDAGRYLSFRIEYPDTKSFTLSGIDIDVSITGAR